MPYDALTKAWIWLIALSAGSAVVAMLVAQGMDRRIAGAAILVLALLKSRTILTRYLGLSEAPSLRRGFNLVLTLYCVLLLGLYLIGGTSL
ncbi:cytochrome C oxidase subunit IV family protein [uncultured Shimia sp.]|uniref:cytochrome C oxidase subunit IV family protein n=1 Tax=uncultured Shimia sp. TaxID=573152 RepID=UPI00261C1355|nr:cytochrome C oxidase subunit IV family protein [uncultured Shimia sp.]